MVLLFVVCGWREEAVAGVCLRTYLVHFYIRFFGYQGYERRKNCKPSCITATPVALSTKETVEHSSLHQNGGFIPASLN
jgi:hypothetical protein